MKKRPSLAKYAMIAIVIFAIGFSYYKYKASKVENAQPNIITAVVKRGNIQKSVHASGTLKPLKTVKVGAQVSGAISKLFVTTGDYVKKGEPIAEIDARIQKNSQQTAKEQLISSQASVSRANVDLQNAQVAMERTRRLFQAGAAAKKELEAAEAAYKNALSSLNQAQAASRSRQIDLENASVNLGYTSVTSPIDGVVISTNVEQGNTVNAVQTSPTLVTVAQVDKMLVQAEISEADIALVRKGQKATFTLMGSPLKHDAIVSRVNPAPLYLTEGKSQPNGAIYYYAELSVEGSTQSMRIGMTAICSIQIEEHKDVLFIPITALLNETKELTGEASEKKTDANSSKAEVELLQNGKHVKRSITTGISNGIDVEVTSGLKEGETVIIASPSTDNQPQPMEF